MKRTLFAVLAFFVVGSALGQSPTKIRITTWNLEWFPNASPHEATHEKQAQRIEAAADVLKKLDPDILLLQEMRDYDACARLGEAIHPGAYQVAICSAFKGAKQQEAIIANGSLGVSHQFVTDDAIFAAKADAASVCLESVTTPLLAHVGSAPHREPLRQPLFWHYRFAARSRSMATLRTSDSEKSARILDANACAPWRQFLSPEPGVSRFVA